MKKLCFVLTLISIFMLVAVAYAQGPGMMGGGEQGWKYCPYCGSYIGPRGGYGMGPDMMGGPGRGYGMGPGMMGGYGMNCGVMGRCSQSEECQKFLDDTAKERKNLHEKRFDYQEAYRDPKTTKETLINMEKEIRELQEKIYAKSPRGCW